MFKKKMRLLKFIVFSFIVVPIANVSFSEQLGLKESNKILVNGDIIFKQDGGGSQDRVVYQVIYKGMFYNCMGLVVDKDSVVICFDNRLNK